jgi:hypothetical protein
LRSQRAKTPGHLPIDGLTALGVALAAVAWPRDDPEEVEHVHDDLPPDHLQWQGLAGGATGTPTSSTTYITPGRGAERPFASIGEDAASQGSR